ncbi:Flp pilus assembly protein CpaB [Croceicoccus naphthovorans]|uniref:Pilus assembly protein CpaB n=1 Tax=Croceicoccus naphthovorans TaxID=1348774 RepID=A0A0G3XHW2_9SPHN|nr:Flp pilus assembly protein CpaB [Croceicoccus naphthovorans]AKM10792.1 pilus assembly protein CpaB [Croceicoccus naphthovorans]MBB3988998.1 pilus assembly protein CpaB [Croceicoccus naphthovorans]
MDKKKLILLVVALVVAVGTALMARSMFAGNAAPQVEAATTEPQGPRVLVATRKLPVGTIITADALQFKLWPKEMVQDAYFVEGQADMNKLLGTVARFPVTAGQPVTQGALVMPGDRGFLAAALGPGMRAVTIPVSAKTAVAGFVFPGDRVDLMLTQKVKEGEQSFSATETVLRNLRVIATDTRTDSQVVDGKTVVAKTSMVTIEATPRIAEKISVAQTLGSLSLSLRPLADTRAELDRAIARGEVVVPDGASPEEEEEILRLAMNKPQEGKSTYQTGGDVSRFASRINSAPAPRIGGGGAAAPAGPAKPTGPVVRITRGTNTAMVPVKN